MQDPEDHDSSAEADCVDVGEAAAQPASPLLDALLDSTPDSREPTATGGTGPRTRVGWFVEWSSGQAPRVEFPGNERGPLAARSIVPLDPTTIAEAIASERGVLLTFEDGRPDAPIITGLLQDLLAEADEPQIWDEPGPTNLGEAEARVDGRRIEFEAEDEIVLRCGQASIVLRRNGRVVIRGTYVESRSHGVNRIKGGSVQIN